MGCCMKQKGSLRYTVLCMIACSTGILQQLIAEAAGCTDAKKAAAFALLGAGFLLYGLWESYLSELSSWIPLISFTCTALLPLCSFHWLILIPFALFSGMLLSFCLSRFLSAAPEKRRYLKLGAAFGLYASGQALYTVSAASRDLIFLAVYGFIRLSPVCFSAELQKCSRDKAGSRIAPFFAAAYERPVSGFVCGACSAACSAYFYFSGAVWRRFRSIRADCPDLRIFFFPRRTSAWPAL